jgi:hypothetical protein
VPGHVGITGNEGVDATPLFLFDDSIPYKAKNLASTVCRKVYGTLAGLRKLADFIPFAVRMPLIDALVIPFFIPFNYLSKMSFIINFHNILLFSTSQ